MAFAAIYAQPTAPAAFEVASVRQNRLDDRIVTIDVGPGPRFAARGYTLVLLIQRAYGVMDWNITGGPSWIRNDRFDIVAKADIRGNLTDAQLRPMLASLLADRFKLQVHRSTMQTAGYAIQIAKGGPKLTPASDPLDHADSFRLTTVGMRGHSISMHDFARFFAGKLGVVAVDQTGLTGLYDFQVDWKMNTERDPALQTDPREALREIAFDVIETRLGLKAVQKKITVETIIIDHAERPTEN